MSTLVFCDWFNDRLPFEEYQREVHKVLNGLYRRMTAYPVEGPIVLVVRPSIPSRHIPPNVIEVMMYRTDEQKTVDQLLQSYGAFARVLTDQEIADLFAEASCSD